ncbi:MAG: iron ABC transporter permease [Spirochaetales bacterium]
MISKIQNIRFDFWFLVKIIVILFMVTFLIYPFLSLVTRSFFSTREEGVTLYNYIRFFTRPYYYQALFNSLFVSISTTLTAVCIGVPIAYLMTRYNLWGKRYVHILIIMSLMSPPFIGAYSWIVLFGRSGFITELLEKIGIIVPTIYGERGILTVFTLKLFPYVYLFTSGAMGSIDSSLEEAAENLGANKLKRIMTVTLPVILPSILAGAIMVFMTSLADFGTPMLIGEGYTTLPVLVYNEYMSEMGGNANLASALSVIVVTVSMIVLFIQRKYVSKKNYVMTAMRPPAEIQLKTWKRFLVSFPVWFVTICGILPQIVVIVTGFRNSGLTGFKPGFSFDNYTTILNRLSTNITNSFVFSITAMIFILIIGMLMSYVIVRKRGVVGGFMDFLIMFPYVIPGAVLGISMIVAFNKPPLLLTGTAAIMIIAMVVRKLPYTVRSGSAFLHQMDPCVEEASISLGVSPMKTFFTMTARLMAPGILSGAILSWITCLNELSASIMLYSGTTSTISVAIYTEIVRNSYGTAAALATILTFATITSLFIFMKVSKGKVSVV